MRKSFHRADRVSEEIMKEVSNIIRDDMKDPRLGMVSITRVELSRDLRHAKVFISVLGSGEERDSSMSVLRNGTGFIRKLIGRRMRLKAPPELIFKADDSIERSARINEILKKVGADEPPAKDAEEDEDS
ncbi:MAG: 30S ribosome-binding factor RbfA [Candidatus Nitrospinota bacterium M3_3B_026]